MWDSFVELLRATIFSVAHVCGGSLGGGILLVSAGLRLALLPLTLRMARRAREQQRRIAALQPQLEALKRRYTTDQIGLMRETRALYAAHDIKVLTPSGFTTMAIQLPLLSGLFAAVRRGLGTKVRFLWVADLARPDGLLLLGVAALSALGVASAPAAPGRTSAPTGMLVVALVATIVFFWSASSAVALSMGAQSLVSVVQNWLLSRDARRIDPRTSDTTASA